MSLTSALESILFVASKPLSLKKLTKVLAVSEPDLLGALDELRVKYRPPGGVALIDNRDEWQLVSSPEQRSVTEQFIKAEISGELTRPQLETLTVVAYCGPITKPELEAIRGVNCSLILRNLLLRGFIKERVDAPEALLPTFQVTMDFVRHLGLASIQDLPDYPELHRHEFITRAMAEQPEQ